MMEMGTHRLIPGDNGPQGGHGPLIDNMGGGKFEDVTKKAGIGPEFIRDRLYDG